MNEYEYKIGYVDWFGTNGESYGYVVGLDGIPCFVHYSHISDVGQEDPGYKVLKPKDKVRYIVIEGYLGKGTQADLVEVLERHG